ncbi:uncharacterized protein LOC129731387 [Wyeomyia smithii]|uniref:uncharacterized protein LOC129731387 n=1 Tax=Wyeomyia smithii TaxID=174621 RepID=UPI002467D6C6|nr:uncharacterized protein LOC129731387 [Wyeomyia smithii]
MDFDHFTLVSNEVVEFPSTWRVGGKATLVDSCVGTDPPALKVDAETAASERIEISIQTDEFPRHTDGVTVDNEKLSSWLRKIYPLVEEELSSGITEICEDDYSDSDEERLIVRKHQDLTIKLPLETNDGRKLNMGAAAWLSVLTRNAPLLVVSCSSHHEAWCEHTFSTITVFIPTRNLFNSVQWTELCSHPVKACVESLVTNPFNKDMFAGGTVSGDLYIWCYEMTLKHEPNSLSELFSETTDNGQIVDMTWIRPNPMTKDFGLLSCHSDGVIILWKIGKNISKNKTFQIPTLSTARSALILTRILSISNSEFVLGTENGGILLCSMTQLIPMGGTSSGSGAQVRKNYFAPTVTELKSHSFAVTTLQKIEKPNQQFLLSCDLTGEVFFHDITDTINSSPTLIIKMPLPFKNRIFCTKDMRFILSPRTNGGLEAYKIDSGTQEVFEAGGLEGTPSLIKVSSSGKWIITGPYDGGFTIYSIEDDV